MNSPLHTDVLIIGAGAAGIAAAVAPARSGCSTILAERNAFPGGKATAAEVGTVCGLYEFSKKEKPVYIVEGFAKEFAEQLQQLSRTKPLQGSDGLHYLPYDITAFKELSLDMLHRHHVKTFFNTALADVHTENDIIRSVTLDTGGTSMQVYCGSVIDCSGDAVISRKAGLPLIEDKHYQAAAQVFSMKNVVEDNEARLGLIIMKTMRAAIEEKKLPAYFDRVYIVQGSLKHHTVHIKVGVPVRVTYADGNMDALRIAAHEFVQQLSAYLISNIAAFKNASIDHIAPEVGTRIAVRTAGKYTLTGEDVLGCRKFEDAVAKGSWPVEEWELDRRVRMRYLKPNDYYEVPAGCLQSAYLKNLFMAGRNISATNEAIASARVMGTCLQTGYAAGLLASAAARV